MIRHQVDSNSILQQGSISTTEALSDEIQSLRRCVGDLVALSALPAVWTGKEPLAIAEDLAEMLLSALRPDIIYLRLKGLPDGTIIEVARAEGGPDMADRAREIGQTLASHLTFDGPSLFPTIPSPNGPGMLRIDAIPIGFTGEGGVVIAGSRQPDFPTEMDHLLLRVGANQVAIWLQQIHHLLERKKVEAALRESEERFRTLANLAPSIIWTAAPDGTMVYTSDQWFNYCGITPQQNARDWPELVLHPDDRERCISQWTRALELGLEYEIEVRNRRHDGEYRWFLTRAVPIRNAEGQITVWFGTSTDIHDRKQMEEALAEELARRAAMALDKARAYEAEQQARQAAEQMTERIASMQAVTAKLSKALTPSQVAQVILNYGLSAIEAHAGLIAMLTEDGAEFQLVEYTGYPADALAPWRSFPAIAGLPMTDVVQSGQPLFIDSKETAMALYPALMADNKSLDAAWALLPLMTEEKRVIGGLSISFPEARNFTLDEREFLLTLAQQCAQALERAHLYDAERKARADAETAGERLSLLVAASEILIASPDYEVTLPNLARLIVTNLADWCVVDVIGDNGLIHRLAVVHRDPAKAELAAQLQQRYPAIDPQSKHTIAKTLRQGQSWFDPAMTETRLVAEARDAEHLRLLRGLGFASEIVVPLIARGRSLGALTLVRATVERGFEPADLTLAELLAYRAALSVDNARLYREAQQLNTELEERVTRRTAELQATNVQLENEMAERERTQADLSEVQRRLMENEEVNRSYLAQELHDGPVQELYALSYQLNELKGALSDEANSTRLAATQAAVQRIITTMRAAFTELRPPALAPFGLEKAIRSHAEQFQAAHPELAVGLILMPDGQTLPERVRLTLFRIYQEALNNILRHAGARYILIRFVLDQDQATLEIQDDGRGFKAQDRLIDLARQGHLGLVGISERTQAIGGQLQIISVPGEGTTIRVTVPRHNEAIELP